MSPEDSRVITIGILNSKPNILMIEDDTDEAEAILISRFVMKIIQNNWRTKLKFYNGEKFDIPFLIRRAEILGQTQDAEFLKCLKIEDPFDKITRANGRMTNLVDASQGYNIPNDDIKGADVPQAFKEGRYDEIIHHCTRDVERTAPL